jgi:Tol biopolymer transport system component
VRHRIKVLVNDSDYEDPVYSPDGSLITYFDNGAIGVMRADTSHRKLIVHGDNSNPDWSPDGSQVIFDDGLRLYTVNRDGTDRRFLANGSEASWTAK